MARPAGHPVEQTRVATIIPLSEVTTETPDVPSPLELEWRCPHCPPNEEFKIRKTQIGDARSNGASLSYELKRTPLAQDARSSQTLRNLLVMSAEEAESLTDLDCIQRVAQITEDLLPLLQRTDVGSELHSAVQTVDESNARAY